MICNKFFIEISHKSIFKIFDGTTKYLRILDDKKRLIDIVEFLEFENKNLLIDLVEDNGIFYLRVFAKENIKLLIMFNGCGKKARFYLD